MTESPNLLKITLDRLYDQRSQAHLANDPLSFCHRFIEPPDQEVAALISSVFAYGSVKVIKGSLSRIFSIMGDSPSAFVDSFNPKTMQDLFTGFRHRFNNGQDLCALLWGIRMIRKQAGGIEAHFRKFDIPEANTVEKAIIGFSESMISMDYSPIFKGGKVPEGSSYRFLFPSPAGGSACKRLCMFLRWVARPSDGIDLGLWRSINPSRLIIPVDRHIHRIGRLLGLTGRNTADWKMALEITESLRLLDPLDPVRYDFSLCHLGISEGCEGRLREACGICAVRGLCAVPIRN